MKQYYQLQWMGISSFFISFQNRRGLFWAMEFATASYLNLRFIFNCYYRIMVFAMCTTHNINHYTILG